MARHPADNLDDDPEVRAVRQERPPAIPAASNSTPGAGLEWLTRWETDHARRLREARDQAWTRRTAAEESRTYRRMREYRWGGWTVLILLAVSCWLCGFACALFV